MIATIEQLFIDIRTKNPLIHHLTNKVTVNDCANITLAIGGSPVMADHPEEAAEMTCHAAALVVNFGTLQSDTFEAMLLAGKQANDNGIPVVFDPVGVGATSMRTEKARYFLQEVKVDIIRGNETEIAALIKTGVVTRGVDAGETIVNREQLAMSVAAAFPCIVVMSGARDIVTNGKKVVLITNGTDMLAKVTGTGCMSTSLIANFAAVSADLLAAAVAGMSLMGIAGEKGRLALGDEDGLGTFKVKIFDYISMVTGSDWGEAVELIEK